MTPPDPTQVDENDLNDIASMTETPTMNTSPSTAMATADMTPPDPTQVDENDLNDIASMTETPTMNTSPSTAMATADMTPPDPTQVDENDLNDIANMTEAPTMNSTYFAYSTDDDIYMNATDFNNASDLLFDYEDDK